MPAFATIPYRRQYDTSFYESNGNSISYVYTRVEPGTLYGTPKQKNTFLRAVIILPPASTRYTFM
jgi:hypothetical protein